MTIVDECNNADTGVGADIAFNNQLDQGIIDDLENIIIIKQ
jgi:hypothetical protein